MARNERYIPAGKKRYQITLTQENAEYIKSEFQRHNIPPVEFSLMVDLFVAGIAEVLKEMEKSKGEMTVGKIIDAIRKVGAVD